MLGTATTAETCWTQVPAVVVCWFLGGCRRCIVHTGPVTDLILDVLPMAIAIALSPFPVIPAIMLLLAPRAVAGGSAFLAGWIAGVTVAVVAMVVLSTLVDLAYGAPTWAAWVRLVLGAALIGLGVAKWLQRRQAKKTPAWMASLNSASPGTAARLGVVLSLANPKILMLAAAAGVSIGSAEPPPSTATVAGVVVVFVLISSVSVAAPLVAYLVAGERVATPLRGARDWLEANNSAVMAVVFVILGALVLLKGLEGV